MNQQQIDNLNQQADSLEAQAMTLRSQAEEAKMTRVKETKTIREWLGYQFESSTTLTPQFALFIRQFKKAIQKIMEGYELVNWSRGHFEGSGFLRNLKTGKLVYFSILDVRSWPDAWYNDILIRTAENEKDYTGGSNNEVSFEKIKEKADWLTA